MTRFTSALLTALLIASNAAAHPGHAVSGGGWGLAQHLSEPLHLVGLLCALVAGSTAVLVRRRRAAEPTGLR